MPNTARPFQNSSTMGAQITAPTISPASAP
jgi:hypothetical protein